MVAKSTFFSRHSPASPPPQVGERLKGVVVAELDGASGKKAWVNVGVMRRAKGGKFSAVDGMIRLSKEKGLKPKKVAIDRPVTVYVSKASSPGGFSCFSCCFFVRSLRKIVHSTEGASSKRHVSSGVSRGLC